MGGANSVARVRSSLSKSSSSHGEKVWNGGLDPTELDFQNFEGTNAKFDAIASNTAKMAFKDFDKFASAVIKLLKPIEDTQLPPCGHAMATDVKINPMFDHPKYPMYVMLINDFITLKDKRLPNHEHLIKRGILYEVIEMEENPGKLFVYHTLPSGERGEPILYEITEKGVEHDTKERVFHRARFTAISHRWLQPSKDPLVAHPDREDNIKFSALKSHLSQEHIRSDNFIWMDYLSIPQSPDAREQQRLAISSLPVYFMWSTNVLVVCPTFQDFENKSNGYLSRGHCLMELATSKLPRVDVFDKWYIPGIDKVRGEWGLTTVLSAETSETKTLDWVDFQDAGSPLEGNFTMMDDLELIYPLIVAYLQAYDDFNNRFLDQLRQCLTWTDAMKLDKEGLPQMLGILTRMKYNPSDEEFKTPLEWVDSTLPGAYIEMLRKSIAGYTPKSKT